jgi:hypothetical protein
MILEAMILTIRSCQLVPILSEMSLLFGHKCQVINCKVILILTIRDVPGHIGPDFRDMSGTCAMGKGEWGEDK